RLLKNHSLFQQLIHAHDLELRSLVKSDLQKPVGALNGFHLKEYDFLRKQPPHTLLVRTDHEIPHQIHLILADLKYSKVSTFAESYSYELAGFFVRYLTFSHLSKKSYF